MAGGIGNTNALTTGKYRFLATGRPPKGCGYLYRMIGQFRRALDREIQAKIGEIGLREACLAQSAARHEGRAAILTRWLREAGELTLTERLAVLREIGAATDARDRVLRALKLDRDATASIFDALYREPLSSARGNESELVEGDADATGANVGDVTGNPVEVGGQ